MDELNQWGCKEKRREELNISELLRGFMTVAGGSVNGNGQHVEMIERRGEVGL